MTERLRQNDLGDTFAIKEAGAEIAMKYTSLPKPDVLDDRALSDLEVLAYAVVILQEDVAAYRRVCSLQSKMIDDMMRANRKDATTPGPE